MAAPIVAPASPLADDVILLRPWEQADLPAIVEACDEPTLSRWLPAMPYPYTEADGRAYLSRVLEGFATGTSAALAIRDARSDAVLGGIGLRIDGDGRAELGYWVRRDARGRGVATRAVRLVSGWALVSLGFRRLQLHADVENLASQRVAERAGFTREGVSRAWIEMRGEARDHVVYSLLPGELAAGAAPAG